MFDKARSKGFVQLTMKRCKFSIKVRHESLKKLFFFIDDGKAKPNPRPENQKNAKKSAKAKARSESTSSHNSDPEFMCLIRANFRSEKITTVVSFFCQMKCVNFVFLFVI